MSEPTPDPVVNLDEVTETERLFGEHHGAHVKPLTPSMRPRGGSLGVNHMRGTLTAKEYFDDEPDPPRIAALADEL